MQNENKLKESFERVKEDNLIRDQESNRKFQMVSQELLNLQNQINELKNLVARLSRPTKPTKSPDQTTKITIPKLEIDIFTDREKNILKVFFEHEDMALSYEDIAKVLNKSPTTIKNQMNDIRKKNNVFEIVRDKQNRNRFRFKEGLKIEKTLLD